MGVRITTWNVNGIRNPFGYEPWRNKRTFEAMFDVLEADIVCFQETKIQRKDLRDDMVLVPGWDCYFSLPKHKKGYSGVVIYTRNSVCAPIKAEEGITGVLTPPNSSTSFRDLPEEEQIGGYPTGEQLRQSEVDATTLDSEGRCVILEFPAFVLIGTYCPANRDDTRDAFRIGFLDMVDARIRNLVAVGKRVIWTGDLNISREELDTAAAEESMRKHGMTGEEYVSTPARRMFNQMLLGGKVIGARDEGRERPVMWDVTRSFHEGRKGMFTCWETKVNARPGNYGSRIDYVICSLDMRDWFSDSNIQEGLLGSDHCPVYAVLKDQVIMEGKEVFMRDLLNPPGMFQDGVRAHQWTTKNLLPMSGKLITEFDRRRNIRDMFSRKPSLPTAESSNGTFVGSVDRTPTIMPSPEPAVKQDEDSQSSVVAPSVPIAAPVPKNSASTKRSQKETTQPVAKRAKSGSQPSTTAEIKKGQKSLKGFFQPKSTSKPSSQSDGLYGTDEEKITVLAAETQEISEVDIAVTAAADDLATPSPTRSQQSNSNSFVDPIVSKESWGKLFIKPAAPKCEHEEPCKTMLTKKTGVNCGRSFWMCARPLGPSGNKEKGTQWRCSTFIWASDWNGGG
ncbi:hypothetical protein EPUS_08056 [Endocarpon pusillum Z07020]|uniref:DNA-(apurinic or apyrimidinic site) endonuclease 2 n=1 Tax=Endocarpon pusillum (strain Z07020 / HMAS-L-300199) TaxID=1263415 RepID=U1GSN6_ENDPU|nr:uncharacterized protein EPUS_08056 [Endocarpon pusillum Z07020]ERF75011.1 hypothetical protein EPUS_08056 [Endocarpon pusillum Z07020]